MARRSRDGEGSAGSGRRKRLEEQGFRLTKPLPVRFADTSPPPLAVAKNLVCVSLSQRVMTPLLTAFCQQHPRPAGVHSLGPFHFGRVHPYSGHGQTS
ncbi:hypothetical protein MPLA_70002 [Mesorhizobium sp. ORS 3359]|nr:hypothetical protein MPLA_70002 [Mesorhizobium sp. ORS 3359]